MVMDESTPLNSASSSNDCNDSSREKSLLLYLMPLDTNGNDRLDQRELARLLNSIGEPPLTSKEQALIFANQQLSLSWHDFVDLLLLG